ncbi:MAG: hypothetical protein MJ065_02710 [Oscillospiraceae bacterium]|nr:hypothetical protein [Oscillospiraceae bacterium]
MTHQGTVTLETERMLLRQHGFASGRVFDDVWYGILADEYRARQHGTE